MTDSPGPDGAILTFLGAAGTVTGSRFLVETPDARVLVDCGMFQGLKRLRQRNWEQFPVDPASIDAVVITHAHVDHVGYLPTLVKHGFDGRVHATDGTVELARIVLPDSGRLQEEEANYANRKGFSKHRPALPLFTEADAHRSLRSFRAVDYDTEIEIATGVHLMMRPAGHILGSAIATLRLDAAYGRRVVFSGDLGRQHHPLLMPPATPGPADVVVMESTYGNRDHDDTGALEVFANAIVRTVGRGGTVLIPAFAVDRTEVVLHALHHLMSSGAVPELTVYVDSPMALAALGVYRDALDDHHLDVRPELRGRSDLLEAGRLVEVHSPDESKALAKITAPSIIVSASGMATGGRVIHHLHRLLPDPRNTVILAGFQAPGTRGRSLADGAEQVKMLGHHVPVRADVVNLPALSVHADRSELREWVAAADRVPDVVYLVHGEPTASEALRDDLTRQLGLNAVVAADGERVRLD